MYLKKKNNISHRHGKKTQFSLKTLVYVSVVTEMNQFRNQLLFA